MHLRISALWFCGRGATPGSSSSTTHALCSTMHICPVLQSDTATASLTRQSHVDPAAVTALTAATAVMHRIACMLAMCVAGVFNLSS
jgi:hypothetical protein